MATRLQMFSVTWRDKYGTTETAANVSCRLGLGISVLEARYVLFQMFGVMILSVLPMNLRGF